MFRRGPLEPWTFDLNAGSATRTTSARPHTTGQSSRLRAAARIVANALIDLRFGALLGGTHLSNRKSTCSDYALLDQVFAGRVTNEDVLVDIGSGGGRVINQWLRRGHKGQIYGIEFNSSLAAKSRRRLRKYANVKIVGGDATVELPDDGTLYYLFNPFGVDTMIRFADRLADSVALNPREVTVLYFNCKYVDLFDRDPRFFVSSIERIAHSNGAGQDLATIVSRPARARKSSVIPARAND